MYRNGVCYRESTVELTGGIATEAESVATFAAALEAIQRETATTPQAVGYRVVHGGDQFRSATVVDQSVLTQLESLTSLAPLHQPLALAVMRSSIRFYPSALHVACFDTAFHATLPEVEQTLPIPFTFRQQGIRRYGFHGLSYESIARQLQSDYPEVAVGKTVVCHLGNGASVCGMINGVSRYTSMSFTPQDGLMMGTRSGRIDPGLILFWLQSGESAERIENILTRESGLKGVSGLTSDMRELLESAEKQPQVKLAIEMYCLSVAKDVAMAAVSLGGIDSLVFTAGIGENSPEIRARVSEHLAWLGVHIDTQLNRSRDSVRIHSQTSKVQILRLKTDEQQVIAHHAASLYRNQTA
jgi:acetate kinase